MAKRIGVVGAGPGGLTAGMILAHRGFDVTIFERVDQVGGRTGGLHMGPYHFDIGPTLLMMRNILDDVFLDAGARTSDHLEFTLIDPMYRLQFDNCVFNASSDHDKVRAEIKRVFPQTNGGFDRYIENEAKRFSVMYPCLRMPYTRLFDLIRLRTLKALPNAMSRKSIFDVAYDYFKNDELALAFSFQATYLGMSPWSCPGIFTMLSYIEYQYGVEHVTGGIYKTNEAMAEVAKSNGATIHLSTPVKSLILDRRSVKGLKLEDGSEEYFDDVILNADFAHAMATMVEPGTLRKYSKERLGRMKYSCSTYMLYLGLDKLYDSLPHHTLAFAKSYRKNVDAIFRDQTLPDDFSFYVCNPSITDRTMAPEGHSCLFLLVPTPNCDGKVDWSVEKTKFRDRLLDVVMKKCDLPDLKAHIKEEAIITPTDWETKFNVFKGSAFNLAHNTFQMLSFRPRNKFEELDNCYLTGGGTHPGSGLPTIYESGRIAANLISQRYGVEFKSHYSKL